MHRALKPGGRFGGDRLRHSRQERVLLDAGRHHPSPREPRSTAARPPGPFSLGGPGVLEAAFTKAGSMHRDQDHPGAAEDDDGPRGFESPCEMLVGVK